MPGQVGRRDDEGWLCRSGRSAGVVACRALELLLHVSLPSPVAWCPVASAAVVGAAGVPGWRRWCDPVGQGIYGRWRCRSRRAGASQTPRPGITASLAPIQQERYCRNLMAPDRATVLGVWPTDFRMPEWASRLRSAASAARLSWSATRSWPAPPVEDLARRRFITGRIVRPCSSRP